MKKALLIGLSTVLLSELLTVSSLAQTSVPVRPATDLAPGDRAPVLSEDDRVAPSKDGYDMTPTEGKEESSREPYGPRVHEPLSMGSIGIFVLVIPLVPWAIMVGFIAKRKGRSFWRWGLMGIAPVMSMIVLPLLVWFTPRRPAIIFFMSLLLMLLALLLSLAAGFATFWLLSLTDRDVMERLAACEQKLADRSTA